MRWNIPGSGRVHLISGTALPVSIDVRLRSGGGGDQGCGVLRARTDVVRMSNRGAGWSRPGRLFVDDRVDFFYRYVRQSAQLKNRPHAERHLFRSVAVVDRQTTWTEREDARRPISNHQRGQVDYGVWPKPILGSCCGTSCRWGNLNAPFLLPTTERSIREMQCFSDRGDSGAAVWTS